jgi:hypothetical protein
MENTVNKKTVRIWVWGFFAYVCTMLNLPSLIGSGLNIGEFLSEYSSLLWAELIAAGFLLIISETIIVWIATPESITKHPR